MYFKNLSIFKIASDSILGNLDDLIERLTLRRFVRCTPSQAQSIGFVPPRPYGAMIHSVNNQWLLALMIEVKIMSSAVIAQEAAERAAVIEREEGRKVGRKELREIRERMHAELLPRAFSKMQKVHVWIDPTAKLLVIDSTASSIVDAVLEQIYTTTELPITPLRTASAPAAVMTTWLSSGDVPQNFTIDQECKVESTEKAAVRYTHHSLDGEEIRNHLSNGKVPKFLALTWDHRISFILTDGLQVKKLNFLDIIKDQADNQADTEDEIFDVDFTIMTGELSRFIPELIEALGGELINV